MKYKVIQNKMIIAVLDGVTYVKQQRNGVIVPCGADKSPCGILSDEGIVWHLEGLPDFTQGSYDTVSIAEIGEAEYEELKAALSVDEEIAEPEPEPVIEPPADEDDQTGTGDEENGGEATQDEGSGESTGGEDAATVPEQEQVMTVAQMRQRILALEEQVATLTAVNNALTEYHIKASDSSINSIAKIRGVSSETANEVSEITAAPQEVVSNDDSGDN